MVNTVLEWLQSMNEFFKFYLVIWGILGCSIHVRSNAKKMVLLTFAGFVCFMIGNPNRTLFLLLFAGVFLFLFMDEKIIAKVEAYLLAETLVGIVEIFIWSVCVFQISDMEKINDIVWNVCLDIVWILAVVILYRYRKAIYEYFMTLTIGWFCVLFFILLGMGLMAGSVQYVMYDEVSHELKKFVLVVQSIVTILTVVGCVALVYHIISKKNMALLLKKEEEKYVLIKNFYEEKQKQNEDVRRYRHDMKKHMQIIGRLCDDIQNNRESVERLRKYVSEYTDTYPVQERICTGHIVADYFLSELVRQMEHNTQFKKSILGGFPEELPITDMELSVLLGNAITNATEELLRIKGPCFFRMEIGNYKGNLVIQIENTMLPSHMGKKSNSHGIGIKNMKDIIRRNDGEIEIKEDGKVFSVRILLRKRV